MGKFDIKEFVFNNERECTVCGFRCTQPSEHKRLLEDLNCQLYSNDIPITRCRTRELVIKGVDKTTARQLLENNKGDCITK